MYARILTAVDGSPCATHALTHAAGLARVHAATLRIVHVVDLGLLPFGPEFAIDVDVLLQARNDAAGKILAAARDSVLGEGITIETALVETAMAQHVAAAIVEAAASWPADVVVLGTHGRRGVERWLLGSVAEGVARRSPVPTLLVPLPGD